MGPETDGSAIGHFDCEEHHVQATGGVSLGKTVFGVRGEEKQVEIPCPIVEDHREPGEGAARRGHCCGDRARGN